MCCSKKHILTATQYGADSITGKHCQKVLAGVDGPAYRSCVFYKGGSGVGVVNGVFDMNDFLKGNFCKLKSQS